MNGVGYRPSSPSPPREDFTEFAEQLNEVFLSIRQVQDMAKQRLEVRLNSLDPDGDDLTVKKYMSMCAKHGIKRASGLDEFAIALTGKRADQQ